LQAQGFKPQLSRLNDNYLVRVRSVSRKHQAHRFDSLQEAEDFRLQLKLEQKRGLFIDYAQAHNTTLADLLMRYLREEAPRHKSFEVEAYKINAMLEDAGLERQDLAAILAAHPNPHPKVVETKVRKPTGARVGCSSEASRFIRKPFAEVVPDDFTDYIDERCQLVEPSTVDREIDIFSAVCRIAINTWRIHVQKSPMDGVRRPRYYNERDRRLKRDEEQRLLHAARCEDRARCIKLRLETLMSSEREEAKSAATVYRRKLLVKDARQRYLSEAEDTYEHIPLLETFLHFQLMTGARRTEALTLTWLNVDLDAQTAYLPETKNGRPRKLALRGALVSMLRQLPRTGELVFPIGVDGLRKAWKRMCDKSGLTGEAELRIHDLRHEAISRVAEAASNTPGGFTLLDLQHFSGHRDIRMLLRYAHLCTQSLAKRLDAAFASPSESVSHHGMRRLKQGASVTLKQILNEATPASSVDVTGEPSTDAGQDVVVAKVIPSGNVISVNFARRRA
jgi:integrase